MGVAMRCGPDCASLPRRLQGDRLGVVQLRAMISTASLSVLFRDFASFSIFSPFASVPTTRSLYFSTTTTLINNSDTTNQSLNMNTRHVKRVASNSTKKPAKKPKTI